MTDQPQYTGSATDLATDPAADLAGDLAGDLARRTDGAVLTRGEPGYDRARTPHFGVRRGEPVAVLRPAHADDVATAVEVAAAAGIPLLVRGGGHHAAGHSTGDGLLLDLGSLDGLHLDQPDDSGLPTVWAGGGLDAGAVTTALAGRGIAVGFGDTGSVGIGGLTLGGGIGFLSRRHGLTIDNLLGAEVVTSDARVRYVDAAHEPDLFWALRGGGGNFGVVTRFRFRSTPVTQVYGGALVLPATAQVVEQVAAAGTSADDALTVIATVMPLPPLESIPAALHGRVVVLARVCYSGPPEQGERAVAPLRRVAEPLVDLLGPMPYPALLDEPATSKGAVVTGRSVFLDSLDAASAQVVLDHVHASDAPLRMFQFRGMGGAIARVDADATAFAHRERRLMVTIARSAEDGIGPARAWVEGLSADLPTEPGGYIGFFGEHDVDRIGEAYPPTTLDRLRRIKAAYDPTNLFRHNDNITPAHEGVGS